jgi:ABC-type branched-subunit amino acid transport system substrate-binding protein
MPIRSAFLVPLLLCLFAWGGASEHAIRIPLVYWRKPDDPGKYDAYVFGMRAAASETMGRSALGGRRIEIVPMDERGAEAESQRLAAAIAADPQVACVVGFSNTKRAAASIGPVSAAGIPILSSAGGSAVQAVDTGGCFFTTNLGLGGEMRYLERFAKQRARTSVAAIIPEKDAYGDEFVVAASAVLVPQGLLRLDLSGGWKPEHAAAVRAFAAQGLPPDALLVLSLDADLNGTAAKELRAAGVTNDIWIARGSLVGEEFYRGGGTGLNGVFELSELLTGIANGGLQEFRSAHADWFDHGNRDTYLEYAAYGYDMVRLAVLAAERSLEGGASPADLRAAIRTGLARLDARDPYDGVSGTYSFNAQRVGGQLVAQYLLESVGTAPVPYRMQYLAAADGSLQEVPTVFTLLDVSSVAPIGLDASSYNVEFTLTLLSMNDIRIEDIDFENAAVAASGDRQALLAKPIVLGTRRGGMLQSTYLVTGTFTAANTVEAFPFDHQTFPLQIRPRDALARNFLVYFGKRSASSLARITMDGWKVRSDWAGLSRGSFDLLDERGERSRQYYYRSAYTISSNRDSLGAVAKFLLPLGVVMTLCLFLFLLPDSSNSDKVGLSSNLLITVIALYFTYATVVGVPYATTIDWTFIGCLGMVLLTNATFIARQLPYAKAPDQPVRALTIGYRVVVSLAICGFIAAATMFVVRALR